MKQFSAEILNEYGPFHGAEQIHGVTFDGERVWFASGDKLNAIDPDSGKPVDSLSVPAQAGTAFDGHHIFQIADSQIQKVDPKPARYLEPSLRQTAARGWHGRKGLSGWGSIRRARFISWTRKQGRFFVASNPTDM